MNRWVQATRGILNRTLTRALPLPKLVQELGAEGMPAAGREEWILKTLAEHPETFRIVAGRLGPWARTSRDPWILIQDCLPAAFGPSDVALRCIQAGLQAWGRALDSGSQSSVARWIRANVEGDRICRVLKGRKISPA